MRSPVHAPSERLLAVALVALVASHGCVIGQTLSAAPGAPEFARPGLVPVPGGVVNAAGGNLIVRRTDLSVDSVLGTLRVEASWNAATGLWVWSHQMHYDGATLRDAGGAVHAVGAIADGDPIPGSVWVRTDASTLHTKGGLAHHFAASGELAHVRWATLDYPRIEYAPTEVSQCVAVGACTSLLWIAPGPLGQPASITDARSGRMVAFEYDALGRLVGVRDPRVVEEGGPGVRYEYEGGGSLLSAIVSGDDERIEYAYQGGRRIRDVTRVGEGDPSDHFEFGSKTGEGLYPTLHTNPLGGRTRYVFDAQRRLRRLERVDAGEVETTDWEGLRPSRWVDAAGVETHYVHADDRLVSGIEPSGNVITFAYEAAGLNTEDPFAPALRRVEDDLGLVEERSYDALGRLVARTNGAGESSALTYHGSGIAVATRTDPAGVEDAYPSYGLHGHWLEREGSRPDRRAFDAVGNARVASSVGERGGILSWDHDPNRHIRGVELAATGADGRVSATDSVQITRRADGLVTGVLRPGAGDHVFVYDALGRVVERRERADGVWHATAFEYDLAGNSTARTRPNGMREEFDYDLYGRPVAQRALRNSVLEGERLLTWQEGRLASSYDSIRDASEIYGYDAAGRLATVVFGFAEVLTREYDLRSRVTGEQFSLPGQVFANLGYDYDLANRPIALTDRATGESLVDRRFAGGRLVEITYGNGLVRTLDFDADGRIAGFATLDASGASVETTQLTHSAGPGPLQQTIRTTTTTPLATTLEEYSLQRGGSFATPEQFMGKRVFRWSGGGVRSFAYDELGNRLGDESGSNFVYNPERNRLLSATPQAGGPTLDYSYDEAGFATSRAGLAIGWTATGRMASHGADTIEWDMAGRVIATVVDGVERRRDLFGGLLESDAASGSVGALDVGEVTLELGSGTRRYHHRDFRGNVRFVSDDVGAVVEHYRYAPYGVDAAYGSASGRRSFVDRGAFGELMLLGARMYDPAVGRFLSPDPVFQFANQFSYTLGNPVGFVDAGGLDSESTQEFLEAGIIVGIAIGALLALPNPAAAAILAGIAFGIAGFVFARAWAGYIEDGAEGDTARGACGCPAIAPSDAREESGVGFGPTPSFSPAPTSCAPLLLVESPAAGRALPPLLALNALLATAWCWRSRRMRTRSFASRSRELEDG